MSGISDRHSLPLAGLANAGEGRALNVRIRIDAGTARSEAGQFTITCLVNLLCRLVESVASVELVGPDAPLLIRIPVRAEGGSILRACIDLAARAVGDAVPVVIGDGSGNADIAIILGEHETSDAAPYILWGVGTGWRAWVGTAKAAPPPTPSFDCNPMGPFLAATLLAGEVFKKARGITRGRYLAAFGYSLWNGQASHVWSDLADGPPISNVDLRAFYLVGAGAVGQGLAYVLGSTRIAGRAVIIDDDSHDDTNLNRCFLAGTADEEGAKVDVVEKFLKASAIVPFAFDEAIADYLGRAHPRLPQDLADAEGVGRFDTVVSCVDKGVSRQSVQGMWPRRIFGGSTEGLRAQTNLYDLAGGTACLACHNPAEPDGERVRILERQMVNMTRDERAKFLEGKVENLLVVLDYLDAPGCGKAGEAEFRAGAVKHGNEFSVGFVSMGAAVLLASSLLRQLAFAETAPRRSSMTILSFLNAAVSDEALAVNSVCDRCEGGSRRRFFATWPELAP